MPHSPLNIHVVEERCERLELENQRLRERVSDLVDKVVVLELWKEYLCKLLWFEGPRSMRGQSAILHPKGERRP